MKREVIEDDLGQTPEEGSSTDGEESYDGDGDQYRNRKEERFIDYYSVPRGRPLSEGKLVRKGIHLKSQDKGRELYVTQFINLGFIKLSRCFGRAKIPPPSATY